MRDWPTRAAACSAITFSAASALQAEPLQVVATFSIIRDFATEFGGERIALRTLVGPDSDTHVYEPRPADAIALAGADVILTNGLAFGGVLSRLIAASGTAAPVTVLTEDKRTVAMAQNAFRYIETAYGIVFLSPQGVSTESGAAAADVAGLIRQIRDTGASALAGQ